MAISQQEYNSIHAAVFGRTDYEPIITFYDHAAFNEELTKQSGRPRYVETPYMKMKPTHPDLKVRDVVSRKVKPEDKLRYPRQWAEYEKVKAEQREFRIPLQALPGMKLSYWKELTDLEIFDAEALASTDLDLGELNWFKQLANRLMEVSSEARALYEGRGNVGEADHRQQNGGTSQSPANQAARNEADQGVYKPWPGTNRTGPYADGTYPPKEKAGPTETFKYSFQV